VEAPAPPPANTPPKPPPAYRLTEIARQDFSLGSGCTNGPFEITIDVPEVRWRSRMRVYTVADRELPLRFESFDGLSTYLVEAQPDERCHARAGEAPATAAPQAAPASSGRADSRAPSSTTATILPQMSAPAPQLPTHLHGEIFFTAGDPDHMPDIDSDLLGNCWTFHRAQTGRRKLRIYLPNVQKVDGVVGRVVTEEI